MNSFVVVFLLTIAVVLGTSRDLTKQLNLPKHSNFDISKPFSAALDQFLDTKDISNFMKQFMKNNLKDIPIQLSNAAEVLKKISNNFLKESNGILEIALVQAEHIHQKVCHAHNAMESNLKDIGKSVMSITEKLYKVVSNIYTWMEKFNLYK